MSVSETSEGSQDYTVKVMMEVQSLPSSEEPPREEWSSLVMEDHISVVLAAKNPNYDTGSGEICTKYIAMSDSSVLRHSYFKYPSVHDPGIEKALYEPEDPLIYPDDGQELYLAVCKEMSQCPVKLFYRSLLHDKIDLKYYSVNPYGVRPMAMALEFNKYVQILDLTENFLNDDACFHLGQMLQKNFTLLELNLSGCRIGIRGTKLLFAGLTVNRALKKLNLNKNELYDSGGEIIAEAFSEGLEIKDLCLSYNNLGTKTATALASALEFRNTLVSLDLSWNNFYSPIGTCNLLIRLGENKFLRDLNLSWCSLAGPRIGLALKSVLLAPSLHLLDLSNNRLQGEAISSLIENLGKAKKLETLNLSFNPMEPQDAFNVLSKLKFASVKVHNLYMDNVFVDGDFLLLLQKIRHLKSRKTAVITYGGVVGTFKAKGPDSRDLVLSRADFLCNKPKKHKVDVVHFFMQMVKNKFRIMPQKDFVTFVQDAGVPLDEDLLQEFVNVFPGPKTKKSATINLDLVIDFMTRKWPDRKLPPTPPPEPETEPVLAPLPQEPKGKGKGKGKK